MDQAWLRRWNAVVLAWIILLGFAPGAAAQEMPAGGAETEGLCGI